MVGAQQRWRELRAQGALIDAAARAAPPRRRLEARREGTSATKPLGLVWVECPRSVVRAELVRALENAQMTPDQLVRALVVATRGELVAPRELLRYVLTRDQSGDLAALSARQREILGYVVEGLSNAEVGRRLYLSESTIKQHLRAAYKVLGVSNRTEAANLFRRGD